jgi:hypothetical protein
MSRVRNALRFHVVAASHAADYRAARRPWITACAACMAEHEWKSRRRVVWESSRVFSRVGQVSRPARDLQVTLRPQCPSATNTRSVISRTNAGSAASSANVIAA